MDSEEALQSKFPSSDPDPPNLDNFLEILSWRPRHYQRLDGVLLNVLQTLKSIGCIIDFESPELDTKRWKTLRSFTPLVDLIKESTKNLDNPQLIHQSKELAEAIAEYKKALLSSRQLKDDAVSILIAESSIFKVSQEGMVFVALCDKELDPATIKELTMKTGLFPPFRVEIKFSMDRRPELIDHCPHESPK